MPDLQSLTSRIDAELAGFQKNVEQFQTNAKAEYDAREARFHDLFAPASKRIADLIRPRLQVFVDRFKDRVQVEPVVTEHLREVTLKFDSPLARIASIFRLSHDAEVKNLVLEQELEVLPILMSFEPPASLTMPLDKIDDDKITRWVDDRVVYLVQTVGAIHRNQNYLKDHLVIDPIAGVQMPKYAAKAKLEAGGKTYYFISEETRQAYAKQHNIATK